VAAETTGETASQTTLAFAHPQAIRNPRACRRERIVPRRVDLHRRGQQRPRQRTQSARWRDGICACSRWRCDFIARRIALVTRRATLRSRGDRGTVAPHLSRALGTLRMAGVVRTEPLRMMVEAGLRPLRMAMECRCWPIG
jgi:hypothetical protein